MDFFDPLKNTGKNSFLLNMLGIVRSTGIIGRCEMDIVNGFDITDKLRRGLIVEDSDEYQKLKKNIDKKEFIFQLFQLLVLGGPLNQYEDTIEPYLQITKLFYKELVR